ncbi:MAG: hypothetical protein ABI411_04995 [Tahibacter sp.]
MKRLYAAGAALALMMGLAGTAAAAGFDSAKTKLGFDALDMDKVAAEDALTDFKEQKYRFAVGRDVSVNPTGHGQWDTKSDGSLSWTFEVDTPDAAHLNFGFNPFHLPAGAVLTIRALDGSQSIGPFTEKDNSSSGQLWTAVLLANSAVLELSVPAGKQAEVQLNLVKVGQGYRGFGATAKHCKAGACNMDVACLAAGDPWQGPRRSVAAYTVGGTDTCTGSLLNNTANDRRMLFITASHCSVNNNTVGATLVAYWNYESATCRTPGSPASGTIVPRPSTTQNGVRFLAQTQSPFAGGSGAGNTRSDNTLLEFLAPANPAYNLFWAGWDRRDIAAPCSAPVDATSTVGLCAGIHHPNVDEKRITFVEANMTSGDISSGVGVHWHAFWDPTPPLLPGITPPPTSVVPGVTEPGSSGSPLYNANQRLIGVLSGGPSACGATGANLSDFYGKLAHAWEGGGTATTALKSYLDPAGAGTADTVDGIGQCTQPATPTGVTATASAANQLTVSWTAVSGITKYRVFRSAGACPGTNFSQIAEVDNVTSYADNTVSGGSSYSYKVASVSAEPCESPQSTCSGATATGVCSLSPTFAGATSATSSGSLTCGVNVNWAAATPNCGAGGQVRYNVFRSTTAGFTPSAANAIQTCVTGTSITDTPLNPATPYYYVVRSEDSNGSGSGVCASGLQDNNTVQKTVTPVGPDTVAFSDDVEAGAAAWNATGTGTVGANFAQVTTQAHSPTHSWFVPDPLNVSERFLTATAPIAVPNSASTALEFYIRYFTEANYDGTRLEYSLDGGTTWSDILAAQGTVPANATRFLSGGYNGTMNANGAFGAVIAWHGDFSTAWTRSSVDLADFLGRSVTFRFHFKSDTSVDRTGFWLDDIRLYYGSACSASDLIFANGFQP